jgi:hypothetical protein
LWGDSGNAARVRINYYLKNNDLYRIRQGIYAKDRDYDRFELATRIFTPAYVSLETVLGQAGVTFQYYGQIFAVSYLTRGIEVDGQKYSYRKIKDIILTNSTGVETTENYSVATPERAFLDVLYLNKDYHFDNPSALNWNKIFEILSIYQNNKRMERKVKEHYENFKADL